MEIKARCSQCDKEVKVDIGEKFISIYVCKEHETDVIVERINGEKDLGILRIKD